MVFKVLSLLSLGIAGALKDFLQDRSAGFLLTVILTPKYGNPVWQRSITVIVEAEMRVITARQLQVLR